MKLFKTNVIDTVKVCQDYFCFDLPSRPIELKSEERHIVCHVSVYLADVN